ncbi:MAG: cupin domain-containing protein [Planctomyces sp.]|nr:cupin domain-containing protein [Planctomyces sp.]MBA4039273.1 cupin domain-containing protein [Planctomyces sp.]MBA4119689.1 cupin domain-containing protein [Isosphaera sp.]
MSHPGTSEPARATVARWDSLPVDRPMDLLERRRVMGQRSMLSHIVLLKGCSVPVHSHASEQFSVVLSGRVCYSIADEPGAPLRRVVLGAGEVIHLPGDVPHGADADEDTVLIDVFSPPSATTGIDPKR